MPRSSPFKSRLMVDDVLCCRNFFCPFSDVILLYIGIFRILKLGYEFTIFVATNRIALQQRNNPAESQ